MTDLVKRSISCPYITLQLSRGSPLVFSLYTAIFPTSVHKRSMYLAQCDDDVASIVGLNCPRLEGIVLTGTNVTNVGLSWLLCCRNLHTIIMQVRMDIMLHCYNKSYLVH